MDAVFDASSVYPYHDLIVEIGRVEMAMERLEMRSEQEREQLQPRLESRMVHLREALSHLHA